MTCEQITKRWVIAQKEGKAPFVKLPLEQTEKALVDALRCMMIYHPDARLIVAQLTHSGELWVESGQEYLNIYHRSVAGSSSPH